MYDKFNAPKRLQDCMLPESSNGTRMNRSSDQGVKCKADERSSDLISDYKKSAPLHNAIDITAHSRTLNSLEHCICKTSMINSRSDQDSNPVFLKFRATVGSNEPSDDLVISNTN